MKKQVKKITVLRLLNKLLRIPQRITHSKLSTNVIVQTETFKNKRIIKVYANINSRYLQQI